MNHKYINLKTAIISVLFIFGALIAIKAQPRVPLAGGSPAMNYSRELLKREDVQNELGLDAKQKETLAELLRPISERIVVRVNVAVKYEDISKLSDEERKRWHAEISRRAAEQAMNQMEEEKRDIEAVLRPEQLQRLSEIDLQWRGILALSDKDLSDKLGISAEHYQRISEIANDFEVKRLSLLSDSEKSENTDSPRYQKRRMLLQETEQKVLALLSDEEKARWTQAIGKPFSFEK